MSASTETLVKLRGLTSEARSKANTTVQDLQQRTFKNKYSYNVRTNRINALSNVQFGGNYSFQLPAFNTIVGEAWLSIELPALASPETYRKYPLLHCVDLISYRAGQKFYEFCPRKDLPVLLNRIRDVHMKSEVMKIFVDGSGLPSSSPGVMILPLILPWSIWHSDRLSQPIRHGNRGGGLFDNSRLADNLVIELQMATRGASTSSSASTFVSASDLGNVTLHWEEVVCSSQVSAAIRKELPSYYCIEEYTRLEDQVVSFVTETVFKVASLVSRAGTTGFYFRLRNSSVDSTNLDCMTGDQDFEKLVVTCDGRDIYDTDDRSPEQRHYQRLLAGDPGNVGQPKWAHFMFGNTHYQFDARHITGLLKNGSCNELDLTLRADSNGTSNRVDIVAVHLRTFSLADRTVKVANAY